MNAEAEQDPSMYCSEWFVAVCSVPYEKAVQNISSTGDAKRWPMEQICM